MIRCEHLLICTLHMNGYTKLPAGRVLHPVVSAKDLITVFQLAWLQGAVLQRG